MFFCWIVFCFCEWSFCCKLGGHIQRVLFGGNFACVFQQLFSCVERVVDVCVLWTIQLVRRMLALCFGVRSALRVVCFHVCCSYQIQECVFLSVASCKLACFPLPTGVFLQVWSGRPVHQAVEGEIVEVIEGEIMEVMEGKIMEVIEGKSMEVIEGEMIEMLDGEIREFDMEVIQGLAVAKWRENSVASVSLMSLSDMSRDSRL